MKIKMFQKFTSEKEKINAVRSGLAYQKSLLANCIEKNFPARRPNASAATSPEIEKNKFYHDMQELKVGDSICDFLTLEGFHAVCGGPSPLSTTHCAVFDHLFTVKAGDAILIFDTASWQLKSKIAKCFDHVFIDANTVAYTELGITDTIIFWNIVDSQVLVRVQRIRVFGNKLYLRLALLPKGDLFCYWGNSLGIAFKNTKTAIVYKDLFARERAVDFASCSKTLFETESYGKIVDAVELANNLVAIISRVCPCHANMDHDSGAPDVQFNVEIWDYAAERKYVICDVASCVGVADSSFKIRKLPNGNFVSTQTAEGKYGKILLWDLTAAIPKSSGGGKEDGPPPGVIRIAPYKEVIATFLQSNPVRDMVMLGGERFLAVSREMGGVDIVDVKRRLVVCRVGSESFNDLAVVGNGAVLILLTMSGDAVYRYWRISREALEPPEDSCPFNSLKK